MRKMKRFTAAAAAALVLGLAGCSGGGYTADDATSQVRGNLDEIYLGKFDPDYMERVGITEEEAEKTYLDGMDVEADYFIRYYGLETVSDEQRQEIIDLHKEIYSNADYEVQPAVKQSDGTFAVKVIFRPLDIHVQVDEEWDDFLNNFWAQYDSVDVDSMTDEDYAAFEQQLYNDYTEQVIDLVSSKLPTIGHGDETSTVIQIVQDEDGYYVMDQNGFGQFDGLLITYP